MIIEMHSYLGYVIATILTCIAVLFILGMVLGMVALIQEISERLSDISSSFKQWGKSRIPDDFYHKNLNEAIELCENKGHNYDLSLDERMSYRTLYDWLVKYRSLKDKDENQ